MTETDREIREALEALVSHHQPDVDRGLAAARDARVTGSDRTRRVAVAVFAVAVALVAGAFVVRAFGGDRSIGPVPASESPAAPDRPVGGILVTVLDDEDSSGDVYSVTAGGTEPQSVLTGPTDDSQAVWSPDGTRIAFVRRDRNGPCVDSNIYVANADGSDPRRLTGDPADLQCDVPSAAPGTNVIAAVGESDDEPAWSPDGRHLAWRTTCDNGSTGIGVMRADGSDQKCVGLGGYSAEPQWAPDGSRIAFDSEKDLTPRASGTDIWTMAPDGSDPTRVTHDDGGNILTGWSPDGMTLLYNRRGGSEGRWSVWTVRLDGTRASRLTDGSRLNGTGGGVFSPDGASVAFASDGSCTEQPVNGSGDRIDICILSVADGTIIHVASFASRYAWPTDWKTFRKLSGWSG